MGKMYKNSQKHLSTSKLIRNWVTLEMLSELTSLSTVCSVMMTIAEEPDKYNWHSLLAILLTCY